MISGPSLLDFGMDKPVQKDPTKPTMSFDDLFGGSSGGPTTQKTISSVPYKLLLNAQNGKGLQVDGTVGKKGDQVIFYLKFTNHTSDVINGCAVKFNKNALGLV